MNTNWAADHLQTIRTLMERSALYRRALAPTMLLVGSVGALAALAGWRLKLDAPMPFVFWWAGACLIAQAGAFMMIRLQALKAAEPFWSPPTRRITIALMPAVITGLLLALGVAFSRNPALAPAWMLPPIWIALYGCALHAAGFFMPRGMKLFGGIFVVAGGGIFVGISLSGSALPMAYGHLCMGLFFGLAHLAYGAYLHITEKQSPAE